MLLLRRLITKKKCPYSCIFPSDDPASPVISLYTVDSALFCLMATIPVPHLGLSNLTWHGVIKDLGSVSRGADNAQETVTLF